jgi:Na+-driven multidrug efflux pump
MAQYWGARDIAGIRKVMGMCLLLGFTACAFFSTIGGGLAVGIGLIVFFGRDLALSVYSLTRSGTQAASDVLAVLSFAVIFRAFNPTIRGGIWRSGGDTRFSAVLDTSAVWLVANGWSPACSRKGCIR